MFPNNTNESLQGSCIGTTNWLLHGVITQEGVILVLPTMGVQSFIQVARPVFGV